MQGLTKCAGMLRTNMVVRAGKQQVFAALTEPGQLQCWLCEGAEVDLANGIYRVWGRGLPGCPAHWAEASSLLAVHEPELLVFSLRVAGVPVECEFILSTTIGGLNLAFCQRGLDQLDKQDSIRLIECWSEALIRLRSHLELTGFALNMSQVQGNCLPGQAQLRGV